MELEPDWSWGEEVGDATMEIEHRLVVNRVDSEGSKDVLGKIDG